MGLRQCGATDPPVTMAERAWCGEFFRLGPASEVAYSLLCGWVSGWVSSPPLLHAVNREILTSELNICLAKWVLIGDPDDRPHMGWLGYGAWLQLETNYIEILSAMLSFIEWIAFFIHSMLSSGRQAALAMHEACSEILNFRTNGGGELFLFVFWKETSHLLTR